MKMTRLKQKSQFSQSVNWLSYSKNCEIQHKKAFNPTYGNLFAYAANNPVHYIDPDGRSGDDAKVVQDPDQVIKFETIINATIAAHSDDQYVTDKKSDYRCDNYLEAIIEQSGGDSSVYLAGPANKKNVQEHIDNGLAKKNFSKNNKENAPNLKPGCYATFMNESNIISPKTGEPLAPHAGIITVNSDGSVSFSDNSSSNNNGNGGAETSYWTSVQNFQNNYGYRAFYYQKITKKDGK